MVVSGVFLFFFRPLVRCFLHAFSAVVSRALSGAALFCFPAEGFLFVIFIFLRGFIELDSVVFSGFVLLGFLPCWLFGGCVCPNLSGARLARVDRLNAGCSVCAPGIMLFSSLRFCSLSL